MPKIVNDSPLPSCYHLFPRSGSKNLNHLALISFCLARARGAGTSPRGPRLSNTHSW
jgi:hypothetical protein